MFDVFRFAWFAVRTFAGFVLLVLALGAALWAFVKIDSMATRNVDPDARSQRYLSSRGQPDWPVRPEKETVAYWPVRLSGSSAASVRRDSASISTTRCISSCATLAARAAPVDRIHSGNPFSRPTISTAVSSIASLRARRLGARCKVVH